MDITRKALIEDLEGVFIEQNDIESMNDEQLINAWVQYGIHAGSWEWERDNIVIVDEE